MHMVCLHWSEKFVQMNDGIMLRCCAAGMRQLVNFFQHLQEPPTALYTWHPASAVVSNAYSTKHAAPSFAFKHSFPLRGLLVAPAGTTAAAAATAQVAAPTANTAAAAAQASALAAQAAR